jgi:hypothetical protein
VTNYSNFSEGSALKAALPTGGFSQTDTLLPISFAGVAERAQLIPVKKIHIGQVAVRFFCTNKSSFSREKRKNFIT